MYEAGTSMMIAVDILLTPPRSPDSRVLRNGMSPDRAATSRSSAAQTDPVPVVDASVAAVVLAGGSGVRAGAGRNKVYLPLVGRTIVARSLATMSKLPGLRRLLLVIRPEDESLARHVVGSELSGRPVPVELVAGGATRHASEEHAIRYLAGAIESGELDLVLIHDAARPLGSVRLATEVVRAAARHGAALPGVAVEDLVQLKPDGGPEMLTNGHVRVQTPQAFAAGPLLAAYRAAEAVGFEGTDTSACIERFTSLRVQSVPGEPENFKITHPQDLYLAEQLLLRHDRLFSPGS
jgi:2-C-methyl-D-erythritol 4-phosphate cytidylyltransferase